MAPVIGPNFNAHGPRRVTRTSSAPAGGGPLVVPEDLTTIPEIEGWVGDDKDKAQVVLSLEQAKPEDDQRSTLITAMEALLEPDEDPGAEGEGDDPEGSENGSEESEGTPEAEPVALPEGVTKVKDLEAWVGDDPAKAQAVLDGEAAKPEAERRKTLISKMETLTASDGSDLI